MSLAQDIFFFDQLNYMCTKYTDQNTYPRLHQISDGLPTNQ